VFPSTGHQRNKPQLAADADDWQTFLQFISPFAR